MWSDTLTVQEAEYTKRVLAALKTMPWARPLVNRISTAGGLRAKTMPLLFEARFAFELYRVGVESEYEYAAGEGDSTVEFRIPTSPEWLVELVSIRPSQAIKRATRKTGPIYEQLLSTNAPDRAQSEEAEMITAEQKIGEKVFANGAPTKFPVPSTAFHMIVTDMRGYLDRGGDIFDYRQMAYGAGGIPPKKSWMIHYWKGTPGKLAPIRGLFETSNRLRAAPYIQERIHFLGFVCEREYREGEIPDIAYYLANPHFFGSQKEVEEAFQSFPLARRQ